MYVKPTDSHQYLDASSCHVHHSIRSIPYSQALRLNRICSTQDAFDNRCNDLEEWLLKRGYNSDLVRKQILKARQQKRDDLLSTNRQVNRKNSVITLNITYHPAFAHLGKVLKKIHMLLTPDKEHADVFTEVPIVGFKKGKSLKSVLVRAKVANQNEITSGGSTKCGGKRCKVCDSISESTSFSGPYTSTSYGIRSTLNCNSKNVIYLNTCKTCKLQYVGSTTTKFRIRFNNYKNGYRKFSSGKVDVPQASFFKHFTETGHKGIEDWEIILMEECENSTVLRKRESFWQNKLDTFIPKGLNEREVPIT